MLRKLTISEYQTESGKSLKNIPLSYQLFGKDLGSAPIVLVTHALTGNSSVCGESGWWSPLIGFDRCIDLNLVTVLAFDIPGNGYNGFLIKNYQDISSKDVAQWFLLGLRKLEINSIYAAIGGSLGGKILWQMALLSPSLVQNLIPIATDWKATDWVIAQCRVQQQILENSINPVCDARIHAMTFYRTAESLKQKFGSTFNPNESLYNVESWLLHHGEKLKQRFQLQAYKLMNNLLISGLSPTQEEFLEKASQIRGNIFLIGIDSDGFYLNQEIVETYLIVKNRKENVFYAEIKSIHGHDAFLIEYKQLEHILKPIFSSELLPKKNNYEHSNIG